LVIIHLSAHDRKLKTNSPLGKIITSLT